MRQNFEKCLVIVRYCSVSGSDDETRTLFYRSKNLKNWFYALLSISRIVSLCFGSVYRIVPLSDTNWYGSGGGWSAMFRFIIWISDRVIHAVPVITGQATFETGLHTLTGAIVRFLHTRRWSPGWHKTLWFSMAFPFFMDTAKTRGELQARAVSGMLFDDRNDDNTPGLFSRVRIHPHIQYTLFFLFSTL